jgi:adenylosuccinate synthase
MKADVLLGLQWGDEGKGKIVDVLTPSYDIVARFQGGPNAGHTLEFNDFKEILHTIPSGIFRENTTNIIGNGCVVDPLIFIEEIKKIQKHLSINVLKEKILISSKAHIILPSHPILDAYKEEKLGAKKIGSTLKGIGPTYLEKLNRKGLRFIDLQKPDFKEKALLLYNEHLDQIRKDLNSKILEKFGSDDLIQKFERWYEAILFVKSFKIVDTEVYINNSLSSGKSVYIMLEFILSFVIFIFVRDFLFIKIFLCQNWLPFFDL